MAKKKLKKIDEEVKVINSPQEAPTDLIGENEGGDNWAVKTLGVESDTKLQHDEGSGEVLSLRFFDFAANPQTFKDYEEKHKRLPTAQELFQSHLKQIEVELWKDEWQPVHEVSPRLLLSKDKSHYRIIITCRPAKGSLVSMKDLEQVKTLSQIASSGSENKISGKL